MIEVHYEKKLKSSQEILNLLIENGADVGAKDDDGNSIFHIAAIG